MKTDDIFYEISICANLGRKITTLTYSWKNSSGKLAIGQLVEIPLGRRHIAGVTIREVPRPDFTTKPISRKLVFRESDAILPPELLKLHDWLVGFYATNSAAVWQTILPPGLLKTRREKLVKNDTKNHNTEKLTLTGSQKTALKKLDAMHDGTAILRGITGSGKTEIYKSLASNAIKNGKSVIILVPEISLTTQLVNDFRERFDNVIVAHSDQKETERFANWQNALTSKPIIAIGPRSALFLPLKKVGVIVIDECHEPTYHQDKAPRYNALRAAAKLAELHGAKLILGSATPSIADIFMAKKLNRPIIEMTELAKSGAKKAEIQVVDLRKRENFSSESRIFSRQLLAAMHSAIDAHKQILLFHNRRGTASTTLCENCGWIALCPRCYLPLTLHADKFELRCHICNFREKVPISCPVCHHPDIIHKGLGTKKIVDEVSRIFPRATVKRFDGDTEKSQSVAQIYDELRNGRVDIIVGTQQIAKGLDLPNLIVVGIVQADAGLNLPDFGARERTFQLIAQAVGRVGRGADETTAIIQSFQPDAAAVQFGAKQDFWGFYDAEIHERARAKFPPFANLLKLTNSYKTEKSAASSAQKIADLIREKYPAETGTFILGPTPAFYERARDNYRWQVVVRATRREALAAIAKQIPPSHWTAEIDPVSLI